MKRCPSCKRSLRPMAFWASISTPDGLFDRCKECMIAERERYEERMKDTKVCRRCKKEWPLAAFRPHEVVCKTCRQWVNGIATDAEFAVMFQSADKPGIVDQRIVPKLVSVFEQIGKIKAR